MVRHGKARKVSPEEAKVDEANEAPQANEAQAEEGGPEAPAGDAQAQAPEGGRAATAGVNEFGKRQTIITARASGAIDSVTVGEGNGKARLFMSKPTGDELDGSFSTEQVKMLWHFFEQAHRKSKQNAVYAERYKKMMRIGNGADSSSKRAPDDLWTNDDDPKEHAEFAHKRKKKSALASPNAAPALLLADIPEGSGMPKQVWRQRPLPEALAAEMGNRYFLNINEVLSDTHGNFYAIPQGKDGSYMGAFPHAICWDAKTEKDSKDASAARQTSYYCSESNNVTIDVQLMQRRHNKASVPASEVELMESLQSSFREHERANWGHYESRFEVQIQLEFASTGVEGEDLRINPHASAAGFAFKKALNGNKLLVPFESDELYSASHYEVATEMGLAQFKKFKLNRGTSSGKLAQRYKDRKYQFVARVTNPFFASVIPPVRSLPFKVKSVFYNDLSKDERWVQTGKGIVASPPSDVRP